jgi:hypothetical protein
MVLVTVAFLCLGSSFYACFFLCFLALFYFVFCVCFSSVSLCPASGFFFVPPLPGSVIPPLFSSFFSCQAFSLGSLFPVFLSFSPFSSGFGSWCWGRNRGTMVCYPGVSRFSPTQDEEDGNKGMMGCWLCLPKPVLSVSPPRLSFFFLVLALVLSFSSPPVLSFFSLCDLSFSGFYSQSTIHFFQPLIAGVMAAMAAAGVR